LDARIMFEIIDHAYAIGIWILRYIDKNDLPVTDDPTFPAFQFHMRRMGAILGELGHPLSQNPILAQVKTRLRRHNGGWAFVSSAPPAPLHLH